MLNYIESKPKALRSAFIDAMSKFASTVCVVTTDGVAGRAGLTATSVTSVSADTPAPTLLICVNRSGVSHETLIRNGVFCVNVLQSDQADISDVFAGRVKPVNGDKFSCCAWSPTATGALKLANALVAFDCRLSKVVPAGQHDVIFAEVVEVHMKGAGDPLLYAQRNYATSLPKVA